MIQTDTAAKQLNKFIIMSYRQIYYHIVINTKNHKNTLPLAFHIELFKYIWGIIKNKNCVLYRINGFTQHIHLLTDLHPSIALADFVRDIKTSTSIWLKSNENFPNFEGWSKKYSAFTITHFDKERIEKYIKNQVIHHGKESFIDEYKRLLTEYGVAYEDKYL